MWTMVLYYFQQHDGRTTATFFIPETSGRREANISAITEAVKRCEQPER